MGGRDSYSRFTDRKSCDYVTQLGSTGRKMAQPRLGPCYIVAICLVVCLAVPAHAQLPNSKTAAATVTALIRTAPQQTLQNRSSKERQREAILASQPPVRTRQATSARP